MISMQQDANDIDETGPSSPRLVIFDMDGTLTLPVIDFDLIRKEIGIE